MYLLTYLKPGKQKNTKEASICSISPLSQHVSWINRWHNSSPALGSLKFPSKIPHLLSSMIWLRLLQEAWHQLHPQHFKKCLPVFVGLFRVEKTMVLLAKAVLTPNCIPYSPAIYSGSYHTDLSSGTNLLFVNLTMFPPSGHSKTCVQMLMEGHCINTQCVLSNTAVALKLLPWILSHALAAWPEEGGWLQLCFHKLPKDILPPPPQVHYTPHCSHLVNHLPLHGQIPQGTHPTAEAQQVHGNKAFREQSE